MTPDELDCLQMWMCQEALRMSGYPQLNEGDVYLEMMVSPIPRDWWQMVFAGNEKEDRLLDRAARAFAHDRPLPKMSKHQQAKFAMRLRLGSGIARSIGRRAYKRLPGWFPQRLAELTRAELLEWLLVDAWPFVSEVFDEAMWWRDTVPVPFLGSDSSPQDSFCN